MSFLILVPSLLIGLKIELLRVLRQYIPYSWGEIALVLVSHLASPIDHANTCSHRGKEAWHSFSLHVSVDGASVH
jgi:hypothetical protein